MYSQYAKKFCLLTTSFLTHDTDSISDFLSHLNVNITFLNPPTYLHQTFMIHYLTVTAPSLKCHQINVKAVLVKKQLIFKALGLNVRPSGTS